MNVTRFMPDFDEPVATLTYGNATLDLPYTMINSMCALIIPTATTAHFTEVSRLARELDAIRQKMGLDSTRTTLPKVVTGDDVPTDAIIVQGETNRVVIRGLKVVTDE